MNNFANRLESLIKERKIKKKDLAAAIGLTPGAITQMTKGDCGASGPTIRLLANYLDVTEEWLEHGEGKKQAKTIVLDGPATFTPDIYSAEERELIKYYRQLCPEQKLMIVPMMKGLLNSPTKSEENDARAKILKVAS